MATKSVSYDAAVIQEFAQRLYRQAASIILTSIFLWALAGGLLGLGAAAAARSEGTIGTAVLIGAVTGGLLGFALGRERAFKLKLEAQVALCQVQIEKNTSAAHS